MSVPFIITPEAEQDLTDGRDWYERQKDGLGIEFVLAVGAVFERLQANPRMHQIVRKDVRRAVVKRFPYVVFYRALADRTEVIAVHDARRDPKRWQKRV
jgi:plasmid stabilization system protein ParE